MKNSFKTAPCALIPTLLPKNLYENAIKFQPILCKLLANTIMKQEMLVKDILNKGDDPFLNKLVDISEKWNHGPKA
jgi:hypothetical protein